MGLFPFRRALALATLAMVAVAPSACRQQAKGDVRVLVIGGSPRLVDPAVVAPGPSDEVLLANAAQGLVRFDAAGNIVGGLAERWNVSDDGLSYIFRLASTEWPDGRKITAQQVARLLKHELSSRNRNPLKDVLGAIEDVVAMTDRVIEIRLAAPRPNLLSLLAQPAMAILRDGHGSGPFAVAPEPGAPGELRLARVIGNPDEAVEKEEVLLGAADGKAAVKAFAGGNADLVLGGTFNDLPDARGVRLPRNSLRFDPASGLFGLVPASAKGRFATVEVRRLLGQAIDRDALVAALDVPGLAARATILQPGLDGLPAPVQPAWFGTPVANRRAQLDTAARKLLSGLGQEPVRVLLPDGPGADRLLQRLSADWGALGLTVERTANPSAADFRLVDAVAPSTSPAWFLRSFRCGTVPVCLPEADQLLDAARASPVPAQRYALLYEAAGRMDDAQLFISLAAPVRWSLVADRVQGFAGNRYARHTLTDLMQQPGQD